MVDKMGYPSLLSIRNLKEHNEKFQKIQITSDEFTIGRSLNNSVVLTYIAISRKHCAFTKVNNSDWAIEDFSAFGIIINRKKIQKGVKHKLNHNDTIQLDPTGDFVYKFISDPEDHCISRKRIKLENNLSLDSPDIINNVKLKFEESQQFEMKHIEEKIQNAKQMQTTSIILKQQLELDMNRKMQQLEKDFMLQIENLKGEKKEVEIQKNLLEEERNLQLAAVKQEMEEKIADLMNHIQKHNETESELLKENASLKEKLMKEREDFLSELNRENTSKQDLLEQLENKMKDQEERRLHEKRELENVLRAETEQLRLAKEKELQELEEQKKMREQELQQELDSIRQHLEEQVNKTETEKNKIKEELESKMELMRKTSDSEKSKVIELEKERAEAQLKLSEAQSNAEKSLEDLRQRVKDRETELAALAAQRIQQQAEQSSEVITSLQQQLENVRSQLHSVESEKNTLLENICSGPFEGSSKEATLNEVGELMESELQCSICAELFVAATTLGCSHTFCRYCITVWKKKKKECPICRATITSECRSLVLDSFIEKMVANLTDEMKLKRQTMLKDREELDAELERKTAAARGRRDSYEAAGSYDDSEYDSELEEEEDHNTGSSFDYGDSYDHYDYGFDDPSLTDSGSDDGDSDGPAAAAGAPADSGAAARSLASDHDYTNGNVDPAAGGGGGTGGGGGPADGGADGDRGAGGGRTRRRRVEGTPGSYYGGYGRCFRCGARGHWAPGCPTR